MLVGTVSPCHGVPQATPVVDEDARHLLPGPYQGSVSRTQNTAARPNRQTESGCFNVHVLVVCVDRLIFSRDFWLSEFLLLWLAFLCSLHFCFDGFVRFLLIYTSSLYMRETGPSVCPL